MALAGLLLIGVLPLFTKSMSNNVEGNQLTEVTNRARLHVEELMALPVDAEELTVPDGLDELLRVELFCKTDGRWIEEPEWRERTRCSPASPGCGSSTCPPEQRRPRVRGQRGAARWNAGESGRDQGDRGARQHRAPHLPQHDGTPEGGHAAGPQVGVSGRERRE